MSPRTATQLQGRVGRHTQDHGRHCQNWPADQLAVIDLLNRIPVADGGPAVQLSKHVVSGICSDELYRAISNFEDKHFRGQRSGYVDPDGAMLRRMELLAAGAVPGAKQAPAKPTQPQPNNSMPTLVYSPQFRKSLNGKKDYDEDRGIITLPPTLYSAPITARLKVNGGYGGNDLNTFERQLIDDFTNGNISNYRIITDQKGKIYGYVIDDVHIYYDQRNTDAPFYGQVRGGNIVSGQIYRGTFTRDGRLADRQDFSPNNGTAIAESGPIEFIAGGFVAGRAAGLLINLAPKAATVAFAWAAGTNIGEAAYGKTSGVNPVNLLTGDTSVGRTLSPGERVSEAVTGVGFATAAVGAARVADARVAAARAARFQTLTVEEMKAIRGGSPSAKPPLMSADDLNKPVPQIKAGMGPRRMLTTAERTGALQILNVLERVRLTGDNSILGELSKYRSKPMEFGRYKIEGWTEIDLLENNPGVFNEMRMIVRVLKDGDLEAKLLQMHGGGFSF
jgi:hypothetical protein